MDPELIEHARRDIDLARRNLPHDPMLAAFIVRSLPATEAAGLKDLAWVMSKTYCTPDEATKLLDDLAAYVTAEEVKLYDQSSE